MRKPVIERVMLFDPAQVRTFDQRCEIAIALVQLRKRDRFFAILPVGIEDREHAVPRIAGALLLLAQFGFGLWR